MAAERTPRARYARGEAAQFIRTEASGRKMAELTEQLRSGQLTFAKWKTAMRAEIRQANLASYLSGAALANPAKLSSVQSKELQRLIKEQLTYFRFFAEQVEARAKTEAVSIGQAVRDADLARARMYGQSTDGVFNKGKLTALKLASKTGRVHWRLRSANHCEDCVALAAGGPYEPDELSQVPGDGSTQCGPNCKCFLEITAVRDEKSWLGRLLKWR